MHVRACRLGVAGHARVVSGVTGGGIRDGQGACLGEQLGRHINPSVYVIVNHSVIVVPEDVAGSLCALHDSALQTQP